MKIELDDQDMITLVRMGEVLEQSEDCSDNLFIKMTKLFRKIKSQVPDEVPENPKRRIKTFGGKT